MARIVNPHTGEITDVAIGDRLYHWRYGPLTVTAVQDGRIGAHLDDHEGIVEVPGDAWNPFLHDETKRWLKESLGNWLFAVPEGVAQTAGLATHAISDAEFVHRLHRAYDLMDIIERSPVGPALKTELMAKAIEDALAAKEPRLAELARTVQGHLAEIDAQETAILRLRQGLHQLCEQTDGKRATLLELESEQTPALLKENQPLIKQLKADIRASEGEMEHFSRQIAVKEGALETLQSRRDAADKERSTLDEEISSLQSQLAQLRTETAVPL